MSTLSICSRCHGFVPAAPGACPHCGAARRSPLGRAARACAKLATGGAMAVTLMACYGGPPRMLPPPPAPPTGRCTKAPGSGAAGSPAASGPGCNQGSGQPTNVIATGNPADPPTP